MSLKLNLDRVRANIKQATTEDLLDRATVYREGMEPAALDVIEAELRARGVPEAEVVAHEERRRQQMIAGDDGLPVKCERCHRPAVVREWGWHWLWGLLPVFPRRLAYCEEHRPGGQAPPSTPG